MFAKSTAYDLSFSRGSSLANNEVDLTLSQSQESCLGIRHEEHAKAAEGVPDRIENQPEAALSSADQPSSSKEAPIPNATPQQQDTLVGTSQSSSKSQFDELSEIQKQQLKQQYQLQPPSAPSWKQQNTKPKDPPRRTIRELERMRLQWQVEAAERDKQQRQHPLELIGRPVIPHLSSSPISSLGQFLNGSPAIALPTSSKTLAQPSITHPEPDPKPTSPLPEGVSEYNHNQQDNDEPEETQPEAHNTQRDDYTTAAPDSVVILSSSSVASFEVGMPMRDANSAANTHLQSSFDLNRRNTCFPSQIQENGHKTPIHNLTREHGNPQTLLSASQPPDPSAHCHQLSRHFLPASQSKITMTSPITTTTCMPLM